MNATEIAYKYSHEHQEKKDMEKDILDFAERYHQIKLKNMNAQPVTLSSETREETKRRLIDILKGGS